MPKYLTKIWFASLLLIVLIVLGSIVVNGFLHVTKSRIEQESWLKLGHPLSIDDIFYLFPNQIVVKNVVLAEKFPANNPSNNLLRTSKLIIKFSLWEAIMRRHITIRSFVFDKPEIRYRALAQFLQKNTKDILRILDQFSLADIQIQAHSIVVNVELSDKITETSIMDFVLAINGKNIQVNGSVSKISEPDRSLGFQLKGKFETSGLVLREIIVERYNFYAKLWGDVNSGRLQLNGFALLDTLAKPDSLRKISKKQRLQAIISRLKGNSSVAGRRLDPNVYILDVGCRAKLAFPQTQIDAFVFSVNNIPVSLKGTIAFDKPLSVILTGSILANPFSVQTFKRADLALSAIFLDRVIDTSGNIKIHFDDSHAAIPFDDVDINLRNNRLSMESGYRLKFQLAQGDMTYRINQVSHRLELENLTAYLNFLAPIKLVSFHSAFYDGQLDGKIWIDNTQFPLKINGTFILKDAEANKLEPLLDHFAKIHGRTFSQIYFTNDPQVSLKGKIAIQNGQFKEFEFFKWLADNFALESMRTVTFEDAAADFEVDTGKAGLYDINLDSNDVKLTGSFAVDRDKLVSSKLSMVFSRGLLETSPKFRPILARQDEKSFGFDFQLSGQQSAMNFQWLDSELKQNIQSWIPNFIERRIERKIDKSLQQPEPAIQNEQPVSQ